MGSAKKECTKCGPLVPKSPDDFYSGMSVCKACWKEKVKANRIKNRDYYVAYEKQRASLPHRVEGRKRYADTMAGKVVHRRACKKYEQSDNGKAAREEWAKGYVKSPRRKAVLRKYRQSDRGRQIICKNAKIARKRYPEKAKARDAVNGAIRRGRLRRKPCEVCGTTIGVQAHHEDYSRPLDVRWLCRKHHNETHPHPHRKGER